MSYEHRLPQAIVRQLVRHRAVRAGGLQCFYFASGATSCIDCGVGLVASLKKEPTRRTLVDCNEMLVRMSHRGGCGCDPQSGDGAGMLVAMPDSFLRQECAWELPALGDYAVGMCFLPQDEANAAAARRSLERVSRQRGMSVLGWRVVPTDNSDLGEAPLASEPRVEQLFLAKPEAWDGGKFARELYRAQSVAQLEAFPQDVLVGSHGGSEHANPRLVWRQVRFPDGRRDGAIGPRESVDSPSIRGPSAVHQDDLLH